ncbi:hypothetical protein D9757_004631 [Collybiopsis confluens]|uniref:Uncharacterized protein n=1 Tax=Collybiopsis confluens TaxID=2823264 RepID=A0A8H5HS59_9AGAR|nr:hypothetical protein D9757_004631 [Collybiopsis confluens]
MTFDATSQGQLAMVIYEWRDSSYLGKLTSVTDELLPLSFRLTSQPQKTYVCTSSAVAGGFCNRQELGRFILELPSGKNINDTSFWSARVELPANKTSSAERESTLPGPSSLWDPYGNNSLPSSQSDNGPTAWRRDVSIQSRDTLNPSPDGIYVYSQPIQYLVRNTGYYCVVTIQGSVSRQDMPAEIHPHYQGLVLFRNKFDGRLPATDYPKVNFYFAMFIVYGVLAAYWGWLCYQNLQDLLPLQYYLSGLVGLLVIEMVANWGYYRYLNAHGRGTASTVFLIVVAILDAGRNSMSFFMLLVVSLGLSVVKESLGRTMFKCQALAVAHFVFGILYAVGIVELELESTSALILLLFVIPLAFTLSGFLLWIMYSLNATIAQLRARKQRYKLSMFEKLYRILIFTVLVIAIFFVVSSFVFSGRLAEAEGDFSADYAAKSWKIQCGTYFGISTLAMSDELAQDEADAEDYDLESLEHRGRVRDDDDDATLRGDDPGHPVGEDSVVFEIGDEDEEEMTPITAKSSALTRQRNGPGPGRLSGEHSNEERRQLMSHGE